MLTQKELNFISFLKTKYKENDEDLVFDTRGFLELMPKKKTLVLLESTMGIKYQRECKNWIPSIYPFIGTIESLTGEKILVGCTMSYITEKRLKPVNLKKEWDIFQNLRALKNKFTQTKDFNESYVGGFI